MNEKKLSNLTVGVGVTGSFCTFKRIINVFTQLSEAGANIVPVFSDIVAATDNRFMNALEFRNKIVGITGREPITSITDAEPIGPNGYLDVMLIAPCTGNTIAKLANGITDSPVLMAAKAHLRNQKPLILSISTNDALGINLKNIGLLMNMKNIYLVPFGQDNYKKKPNSLISDTSKIQDTIICALDTKQFQPVIITYNHTV